MAKESGEPKKPRGRPRKLPGEKAKPKPKPRKRQAERGTKKLAYSKRGALPRWWKPFMKELEANGGFKQLAKESIGISWRTPEAYLEDHPELKERYETECEEAISRATERILAEGVRRGVKGYEEPLAYQGSLTGDVVRRYSDTLLIFSANARGAGTRNPTQVNFNFDAKTLDELPEDLLERLAAGENPAQIVGEWKARQAEKKGGA